MVNFCVMATKEEQDFINKKCANIDTLVRTFEGASNLDRNALVEKENSEEMNASNSCSCLKDKEEVKKSFTLFIENAKLSKLDPTEHLGTHFSNLYKICKESILTIPKLAFVVLKLYNYHQIPNIKLFLMELLKELDEKDMRIFITYNLKVMMKDDERNFNKVLLTFYSLKPNQKIKEFAELYEYVFDSTPMLSEAEMKARNRKTMLKKIFYCGYTLANCAILFKKGGKENYETVGLFVWSFIKSTLITPVKNYINRNQIALYEAQNKSVWRRLADALKEQDVNEIDQAEEKKIQLYLKEFAAEMECRLSRNYDENYNLAIEIVEEMKGDHPYRLEMKENNSEIENNQIEEEFEQPGQRNQSEINVQILI